MEDNGRILATGWNGFPRGVLDKDDRLNDRETKLKYTVHAEQNCLYNAGYVGSSLAGATLFVYGLPVCSDCAKGVIQSGVRRVYMCYEDKPEWLESFKTTQTMFKEADVDHYRINLEDDTDQLV